MTELACALNTSAHTATDLPPHTILYGETYIDSGNAHRLKLQPDSNLNKPCLLQRLRIQVRQRLDNAYLTRQKRYNLRSREITYAIGEEVFCRNFKLSDAGKYYMAKLDNKFVKVRIKEKLGSNTYKLEDLKGKPISGTYNTADLKRG